MNVLSPENQLKIGGQYFKCSRPHSFGIVLEPIDGQPEDYLHDVLLASNSRDSFFDLVEHERLVVCKRVRSNSPSYRKVRGKSSGGKLSQAEYYHHDGCSCPTKPRFVEIRLPFQTIDRQVATAIAPFPSVMRAMLQVLPESMVIDEELASHRASFETGAIPPTELWDKIQGRITRLVRKEMDAEACRAFFRYVDNAANAYDLPWEMGESRIMLNNTNDLALTMQHRRAFQKPRVANEQNGSLVKRWTAEDL